MGQALYRKYRSKSLSEIVGQQHIVATLQNALKQGRISHAYLFTGPHGVGKTSIARILAHDINGLPYDDESAHLDIIEIDAASNRRIDEIRDLRDKVHIAPSIAKYKVYIIDEVHMLTKEAFNALLKTLEEPPAHVVFILATTEANKLPETIISRTQRFTFRPIEDSEVVAHLQQIAKQENIKIDEKALGVIAQAGNGSFRDSISLLDQLSSYSGSDAPISAQDVRANLGIAPDELIDKLLTSCLSGQTKATMEMLQTAYQQGYEAGHLAKQLGQAIRQQLANTDANKADLIRLLRELIEVPSSSDPSTALLVVLLGIGLSKPQQPAESPEPKIVASRVSEAPSVVSEPAKNPKAAKPSKPPVAPVVQPAGHSDKNLDQAWQEVLGSVKKSHNTLYGVLRMAQATMDDTADDVPGVVLSFQFAFHQKRLTEPKTKQMVSELLSQHMGKPIKLSCQLAPKTSGTTSSQSQPAKAANSANLSTISNIFGSAEVLES
ncbi:MAG: DNA polymerase III subunit gamma/tau [Candidatus Saccharimonadales bacterium]